MDSKMSYEQLEDSADRYIRNLEAENERLRQSSVENFQAVLGPGYDENECLRQRIEELETLGNTIVCLWRANACSGGLRYHQLNSKMFDLARLLGMGAG